MSQQKARTVSPFDVVALTHREATHMNDHYTHPSGRPYRAGDRVTVAQYAGFVASLMDQVEFKQRAGASR